YPPIPQLVTPAQPKPRKKNDSRETGYRAHPGGLVTPSAPRTVGNWVIRPLSQCPSTKIVVPSRPKQHGACYHLTPRTPATCQNISKPILPSEPKTSNDRFDSLQSAPGPSNALLAPNISSTSGEIAMDITDADVIPSQINLSTPKPDFQQGSRKQHPPDVLVLQSLSSQAMYQVIFGTLDPHSGCAAHIHSPSHLVF
ncbi:hypothetical protein PAXRUDRAFT_138725, partial [Paxillus rubicundulus Ve08.2h10]